MKWFIPDGKSWVNQPAPERPWPWESAPSRRRRDLLLVHNRGTGLGQHEAHELLGVAAKWLASSISANSLCGAWRTCPESRMPLPRAPPVRRVPVLDRAERRAGTGLRCLHPRKARFEPADLSIPAQVTTLAERAGQADILVNNEGIMGGQAAIG
ncbi:hypothetical protein [Streptomyces sp. NPDC059701]|uniref:hypothetical protein n=1 Tax=Streptomyces sp. NPDC059701 TaxID=3346914 RepID=UPI0036BD5C0A